MTPLLLDWPTCDQIAADGRPCIGIRASTSRRCLAHLEPTDLDAVLAALGPGSTVDVRGTVVTGDLLRRIIDATRADGRDAELGDARFDLATFTGYTSFYKVMFTGKASFSGATFTDPTSFSGITFNDVVWFFEARFGSDVTFRAVTFDGDGPPGVGFLDATFGGAATFEAVICTGDGVFTSARFADKVTFNEVTCHGDMDFNRAVFDGPVRIAKLTASKALLCGAAVFHQRVEIAAAIPHVFAESARFTGGATMRLRYADIHLPNTAFGEPSTVTAGRPFEYLPGGKSEFENEAGVLDAVLVGYRKPVPSLISLRGADVTDLVLADIDLSRCRFSGAHHLDRLRLEGDCRFGMSREPASSWRGRLTAWTVTRRQVIAEEQDATAKVHPRRVAGLYRQLRKAMEDSKNEPGASDFYYGEMQMRRRDPTAPAAERLIVALYWLVSGYGLRAMRALGVLAALVLLTAGGLQAVGFPHTHPGYGQSLVFAVQSVVSLATTLRALQTLTWQGELLRMLLRVLGPLLLGLALLAIRNRIKR